MKIWILSLCLAAAPAVAETQTVRVIGIDLKIQAPTGYCVVGDGSASERKLWEALKASGKAEIVQFVAPCDELEAYKSGAAEYLNHTAYVAIPKTQGEVKTVPFTRAEFLGGINKSKPLPRLDVDEASRVMKKALQDGSARASSGGVEILGIDDRAVYLAVRGSYEARERKAWRTTSLGATTIVKSLAISIYVSEVEGKPHPLSPESVLQEYLKAFLRDN